MRRRLDARPDSIALLLPDLQTPDYPLADSLSGDLPRSDLELQREREETGEEAVYEDQNEEPETPREPSETAQHAAEAERAGAVTRKMQLGAAVEADVVVQGHLAALREAETGAPIQLPDPAALSGWLAHLAQPIAVPSAAPPPAAAALIPQFDFGNVLAAMQPPAPAPVVPDMTGLLSQLQGFPPAPQPGYASGVRHLCRSFEADRRQLGDQSIAFRQATGSAPLPPASGPVRRGSRRNGNPSLPCKFYRCVVASRCPADRRSKGNCYLVRIASALHSTDARRARSVRTSTSDDPLPYLTTRIAHCPRLTVPFGFVHAHFASLRTAREKSCYSRAHRGAPISSSPSGDGCTIGGAACWGG